MTHVFLIKNTAKSGQHVTNVSILTKKKQYLQADIN